MGYAQSHYTNDNDQQRERPKRNTTLAGYATYITAIKFHHQ